MSVAVTRPSADHVTRAFSAFGIDGACSTGFPCAQKYPPKVTLFSQGEFPNGVFLIEQGLVKLMRLDHEGREMIVGLRAAGWFLGAAAAILETSYAVTAVTVTPSRVSWMGAQGFRSSAKGDAALSWRLHEMHSREVYAGLDHVADLNSLSAHDRLEQFLRGLAAALRPAGDASEVRLGIPLRQWEIAQLIGVTPPYLSELTRALEHEGVLRREKNSIVLC